MFNLQYRQPEFCKWAFNVPRGFECLQKWETIPDETDVLITHTPPIGHGDLCCTGVRAGCVELLATVQKRVKPRYHVFGHIHEGYGISSDGNIIFINASTCDINYLPTNPPVVFDVKLPPGAVKN
uniref:Calcineurin-like phosphoesterase domain-containing protein n=1 Tax=Clastoptera arizonana TaxID=38151 RepID=A0A1B6DNH8_9HEMI